MHSAIIVLLLGFPLVMLLAAATLIIWRAIGQNGIRFHGLTTRDGKVINPWLNLAWAIFAFLLAGLGIIQVVFFNSSGSPSGFVAIFAGISTGVTHYVLYKKQLARRSPKCADGPSKLRRGT